MTIRGLYRMALLLGVLGLFCTAVNAAERPVSGPLFTVLMVDGTQKSNATGGRFDFGKVSPLGATAFVTEAGEQGVLPS